MHATSPECYHKCFIYIFNQFCLISQRCLFSSREPNLQVSPFINCLSIVIVIVVVVYFMTHDALYYFFRGGGRGREVTCGDSIYLQLNIFPSFFRFPFFFLLTFLKNKISLKIDQKANYFPCLKKLEQTLIYNSQCLSISTNILIVGGWKIIENHISSSKTSQ